MKMIRIKITNKRFLILHPGFEKENKQPEWNNYQFCGEKRGWAGTVISGEGRHTYTVNIIDFGQMR